MTDEFKKKVAKRVPDLTVDDMDHRQVDAADGVNKTREYILTSRAMKAVGDFLEIVEDMRPGVLCVDMDHTLTTGGRYWEEDPEPDQEMLDLIEHLYRDRWAIVIWTARPWKHAPRTAAWLQKHGVRYHGLRMNKGAGDAYVDDKMKLPEDAIEEGIQVWSS